MSQQTPWMRRIACGLLLVLCASGLAACGSGGTLAGAVIGAAVGGAIGSTYDDPYYYEDPYYYDVYYYSPGPVDYADTW